MVPNELRQTTTKKFVLPSVVTVIIALLMYWIWSNKTPDACNLTGVFQRDFNIYYGLMGVSNPLLIRSAEQSNTANSECRVFYDAMNILPPDNTASIESRIILAARGAGKTQIRQCVLSRLPLEKHMLVKIYGVDITTYLDNFIKNTHSNDTKHGFEQIRNLWST
ncbi:unnamed protein product [Adineta ricciae]|uniref:Uncharacterized protein n=1 Tax=Adineta ricciae TaxID=249248 RepID=A0A815D0E9_ADIRI|nr:unnamed protein product [Adineta ricciae]CAF1290607.1 unnamed protein product [Adineta ricciae]